MKIILALLIFSLIVLFHEFGHFLLAKRGGIGVTEFSLGMGPRLFSKQIGETRYSVKLLPFGGSCMMVGEDGESDEENSFGSKSVWTRISVVAAGPIFNFILAFFLALFIVGSIGYDAPDVVKVMEGYPAAEAGMQPGDRIVQMNKTHIHVYREVSLYVQMHQGETVTVTYERDGERHAVTLEPKMSEYGTYLLGFQGSGVRTKGNVFQTVYYSAYEVKYWISTTLKSLAMMFHGQVSADDISGPVGIVNAIGNTYEASREDGGFLRMAEYAEYFDSPVSQPGCDESAADSGSGRRTAGISPAGSTAPGQADRSGEGGHGPFCGTDASDGFDAGGDVQ